MESCQALVILALQQHGLGEASNAASLCSLAAGMAIDLRLNEALPSDSDHTRTQIASRLWWNLYVLDKMVEIERGRPFRLRLEDTNTPWPSTLEADEYQLVKVPHTKTSVNITTKTFAMTGFEKTIELVVIIESIGNKICSVNSKRRICNDLRAADRERLQLLHQLQDYEKSLERSNLALGARESFRPVVPAVAIINAVVR
jgi:hypothetical protein